MLQYLYKLKTRYGVAHVDLGPLFTVSRLHLQMLWSELVQTCRAEGCSQVIVERSSRFRDLRASVAASQGDLLCGFDAEGLRVGFCLYNQACEDHLAEFAAVAAVLGCTVQHFETIDEAIAWVGTAQQTPQAAPDDQAIVRLAEGAAATRGAREASRALEAHDACLSTG